MLEAMLNHFRSYGMEDLEFIIVNSKLSHSQERLPELQRRVNFSVYQETDDEEVWSVMEGGKDDMYVYDRCGRLTYYIPFPLSILNESPLVSNAILATYFRSPCGVSCDLNQTLETDEFVTSTEDDFEAVNTTEQDNLIYNDTDLPFNSNETQYSNDLLDATLPKTELDSIMSNTTGNLTDYDYPTYDDNLQINETNSTNVRQAKSYFNSIYRLFFNVGNNTEPNNGVDLSTNDTSIDESNNPSMIYNVSTGDTKSGHIHHTHHGQVDTKPSTTHVRKKSDRCLEADYEVCKSWSKKRLLHAQRCCSEMHTDPESHDHRSCDNFRKKRCKKLQPILKCCIKTAYTEPIVTEAPSTENATLATTEQIEDTTNDEMVMSFTAQDDTATTEVSDVVCCRDRRYGKQCRVVYSGTCEEGEYIERSPSVP